MRYVSPYGVSDPDAPYINGDPSIGQQGSIPPAAAFEHPMRELHALIEKGGRTPVETDLTQFGEAVRSQRLNYAEDTGTANNLVAAYDPPIVDYQRGLTLRVKVRATNTGPCRINAGAGNVPIRKMNGADVGVSELPAGSIATLVHDGTAFQLSNFGGGGGTGTGDVFMVNVPYTVDLSTTPGTIIADFSPPITALPVAGDILAVKVANTADGPTTMIINGLPALDLAPNGGGPMLQGDITAEDVVQFFYDGAALRFMPNPEINADVTYTVGPTGQFPTIDEAFRILKRKTIGANGYVTLLMAAGIFDGNIAVAHPSGDRLTIRGTMIGAAPIWSDFAATGNTPQRRAQDAIYNANMLRTRYGTEIRVPYRSATSLDYGFTNVGGGRITFRDLLITGSQPPLGAAGEWSQIGITIPGGTGCVCINVSAWGLHCGFQSGGSMSAAGCFASGNTYIGYSVTGQLHSNRGGSFGNASYGYVTAFGLIGSNDDHCLMNGGYGYEAYSSGGIETYWCVATGSAIFDYYADVNSSIRVITPATWGTTSPPMNTVGNLGSTVASAYAPRPPKP